ncbi:uncharacterized protein DS421_4g120060 [Arachis hypogaea]|nr:uncharacterized protein DS421_4g120060 [Arachis hypogaea]
MEDEARMYRLNGVAHVAGYINQESTRVISGVMRQQNMPLYDWIILYLETAGLYHLARLNSQWFWVDEPLLSAFVERWRPETHTFHMPFGECTMTLQDVAYQLGLPIDGEAVSGCLTDFENLMENGRPAWVWFRELFGELPPQNKVKQMTVCYTWFHERTQTGFTFASCLIWHRWTTWVDIAGARLHWPGCIDVFIVGQTETLLTRWATYLPRNDAGIKEWCLHAFSLDRLLVLDPYSSPKVAAVAHPLILVDEHRRLWTAVTSLIYFAAIECHQVDRVVPQFGSVQHLPQLALNIDWLHAKDGKGGDRWFPRYYQEWHLHWENRVDSVIPVDRVADPGPLAEYLDWWCRVAHRFLSPNIAFHDPRPIVLTEEAHHRGSSQAPPRVQVPDRPDNRQVDWRRRIGTRTTDREWRWLDDRLDEDLGGADDESVIDHRVPRRRASSRVGGMVVDVLEPIYDVGGSFQLFGSIGPQVFADFTTATIGMDIDDPVSQLEFFRDIVDMLRDDDATHYRPQMPEVHSQFAKYQSPGHDVQPQLPVDLNKPAASPSDPWFTL